MPWRICCFAALVIAVLGLRAGNGFCSDWPTYLHDIARSGVTTDSLTTPLTLQWTFTPSCAPAPGWGSAENENLYYVFNRYGTAVKFHQGVLYDDCYPAIVEGNNVYFAASGEHKVICIDAASATIKWSFLTPAPVRCAPVFASSKIYFGCDDGNVYCLNSSDGSLAWKFTAAPNTDRVLGQTRVTSLWPVRTGLVVDNNTVYFTAGLYPKTGGYETCSALYLYAVNATTGAQVWLNNSYATSVGVNRDPPAGNMAPQGYMAANSTLLMVPSGRLEPAVFNRSTGAILYQIGGGTQTGPGVNGGTYMSLVGNYLYNGNLSLSAYDIGTPGTDQWGNVQYGPRHSWWPNGRCLAASNGVFYMVTDVDIFAISDANVGSGDYTKCIWQRQNENVPDALICAGNTVVAGGLNKVVAYNAATGATLWTGTVDGNARGLAVANGRLIVSTNTGKVYSFGATGSGAAIAPPSSGSPYSPDGMTAFYQTTADTIVSGAGLTASSTGFCVIIGGETGRLPYEISQRTSLRIYVLESDAAKVTQAKQALYSCGKWGKQINVEQGSLATLPYPMFMANLIVDEEAFFGGTFTTPAREIRRVLHPCGGVAFAGQPTGGAVFGTTLSASTVQTWLTDPYMFDTSVNQTNAWAKITRGKIQGGADWVHQGGGFGGNTMSSGDTQVLYPFNILWFGSPGAYNVPDRHDSAGAPLVVNGRMFYQGPSLLMAYDAYNGQFLWSRAIGTYRPGQWGQTGNLATATDTDVFVLGTNTCYRLDAATGATLQTYPVPPRSDQAARRWGWLAVQGNALYGSRRDNNYEYNTNSKMWATNEAVFSINVTTGAVNWIYQNGIAIQDNSIVIGNGKLCFVDKNMTQAQKDQAVAEHMAEPPVSVSPFHGPYEDLGSNVIPSDPRLIVALNAADGSRLWERPREMCDCHVNPGPPGAPTDTCGGEVLLMYKNNLLVLAGTPFHEDHELGPFYNNWFARRSLAAFNVDTGTMVWQGRKNYQTRPIIVGDMIFAEPSFFDLATGVQKLNKSGQPWTWVRNGGCGGQSGSVNQIFCRWGEIACYDILTQSGPKILTGSNRPSCWINFIPADGVVVCPEGSAGCTCSYAIQSSVVLHSPNSYGPPPHSVVGCHLFYNESAFDGNNPAVNAADDNAIATDKLPLLPGGTATSANYSSYAKGINGIMLDIDGTPVTPAKADFACKAGNSNTPSSWINKSTFTVTVRPGAGVNGSTRVELTFAAGVIQNTWLQVTVKAGTGTGLDSDYVFYFGNAIGETGNSSSSFRVDPADCSVVRANPHKSFVNPAPISDMCDFNRDKKVDTADEVISRSNMTTVVNELKLITVP